MISTTLVYMTFKSYWWYHIENINLKKFPIHFPYIFSVTSTSPSVLDGVVHFELTVSTAKLLSSIKLSFDIHILGCPEGVFNFTFRTSGEGAIKKTDIRGPNYPRDERERSKIRL